MVLLFKKNNISALKKGKQKGRVDEADISCLPHQPAASCGLDGQHQLEMPSHIEEPKNTNSEIMLCSNILK